MAERRVHWLMLSERSDEHELSIDGTPPVIEQNDWRFDCGEALPSSLPVIDVPFGIRADERLTDNIPAYGCRGLLINRTVKTVFENFPLDNIQYFSARLVNRNTREILEPYWIANIVGKIACVDRARSDLVCYADGGIKFIDRLVLKPVPEGERSHLFRLAEFLPVMVASDTLKNALAAARVTGFTFYKPEDFSL